MLWYDLAVYLVAQLAPNRIQSPRMLCFAFVILLPSQIIADEGILTTSVSAR